MDRCALFIDAGYLYAEGGKLCGIGPRRDTMDLDGALFARLFVERARAACELPLLRIYWYDAARRGIPTTGQQEIAALPDVKMRLGRLNSMNEQKGVDALIYRDLITLSRERAISEAFLLSGDEDLREGVKAAQDVGVRVTLVGVAARDPRGNQSPELISEADQHWILTEQEVSGFLSARRPSPSAPAASVASRSQCEQAAADFARHWRSAANAGELSSLNERRPRIPAPLDADLMRHVEVTVGASLREGDDLRRAVRAAFWRALAG